MPGKQPTCHGKGSGLPVPSVEDEEVYTERLLLDKKCLIHKAFLLCHPEPPWQICLPSKKRTEGREVSWLHREWLCHPSEFADELSEDEGFWERSFFVIRMKQWTLFIPEESRVPKPLGVA